MTYHRFIFLLFVCATLLWGTREARAQMTAAEMQADLAFFQTELPKRHVDLFTELDADEFKAMCNAIEKNLDALNDQSFALSLQQVTAAMGDAHTGVNLDYSKFRFLPVNFKALDDGIFIRAIDKQHQGFLKGKLVEIGGLNEVQLLEGLGGVVSTENKSGQKKVIDNLGNCVTLLRAAGAKFEDGKLKLVIEADGATNEVLLTPMTIPEFKRTGITGVDSFPPLRRLPNPHWNHFIPAQKLLYFCLNQCRDKQGLDRLVNGTAGFVKQNQVDKFVVDLRGNGGGDSRVAESLIKYLAKHEHLNQKGKLFVIVDRRTFSSAVLIALDLQSRTEALLVGEPASGKPNHYGEVRQFELPNSKLKVNYSTKYFQRRPKQSSDSIELDVRVPLTSKNWFSKIDPCLDAIFEYE